jgi:hypothetical protein
MRTRNERVAAAVLVCVIAAGTPTGSQTGSAPKTLPRTPWGHPDLQGIWNNSTITPLERSAQFGGREFLTAEEARALDTAAASRYDQRLDDPAQDVDAAYNQFWWERGQTVATRRTSLIIDPPDGRLPALTPEGRVRTAAIAARLRGVSTGPEDRNLAERCITRGAPKLPGGYNNNVQIVQTPSHVAIMQEMIHEVRIIPLDGRPHLPAGVGQWLGDSRGRWEGDTLVVETTNYHPSSALNSYYCCPGAAEHLRIVERFTRTGRDTIEHRFTVTDPTTFTRPFTVDVPMARVEGPIFEYACHEGNYAMEGILRGARFAERAKEGTDRR